MGPEACNGAFTDCLVRTLSNPSCEIHWKSGKDLTHATVKKKGKGGKGKGKTITKVESVPSFFRFFESLEFDEEKAHEMDHEEVMAVSRLRAACVPVFVSTPLFACLPAQTYQQMQAEADVGFALKNKIVPNAAKWFTGEVRPRLVSSPRRLMLRSTASCSLPRSLFRPRTTTTMMTSTTARVS